MILGYQTDIEDLDDLPEEVKLAQGADYVRPLGGDRYETVTTDGKTIVLQPMWGKENMIEPQEVFQILFAK